MDNAVLVHSLVDSLSGILLLDRVFVPFCFCFFNTAWTLVNFIILYMEFLL